MVKFTNLLYLIELIKKNPVNYFTFLALKGYLQIGKQWEKCIPNLVQTFFIFKLLNLFLHSYKLLLQLHFTEDTL